RSIFTNILNRCGARVLAVHSATAALAALQSARHVGTAFDVMLLDCNMPEMDGITVAEQIHQDPNLATPIILLTSAGRRGDAARCRMLGIAGYIPKPVMSGELIEAIRAVFEGLAAGQPSTLVTRHSLRESSNRLRLLLAEDNPVNRSMIVRMIEKHGHHVRAVEDGCEALAALEAESFDLILMDVQMPELDGFAATTAIRKRERGSGRHIPILAITAHAMKGDRERCLQHGMDGYLSKPIQSKDLFAAIEKLMPNRALALVQRDDDPDPTAEIFDLVAALHNTENDRGMLAEAVGICLDDFPQQLAQIDAALEQGDAGAIERTAHRVKSGLKAVAARAAARAAERLEAMASSGDLTASRLAAAAFQQELQRLTPFLQSLLIKAA
ncbi:MAG: response regulator, partial [Candidatus Eisenbacteria bacterium]